MHNDSFDAASSGSAGVYRQNALYIRMHSFFDLDPDHGEPVPHAVPMHTHEYVHYLHNVSTTAGQAYLLSNLALLRCMVPGTNASGRFLGTDAMGTERASELEYVIRLMRAQLGSTSLPGMGRGINVRDFVCGPALVPPEEEFKIVQVQFESSQHKAEAPKALLSIGLSFITEGVAYEVDRELRRKNGDAESILDVGCPGFPYLAFRLVVDAWTGRDTTAIERIKIGVGALSFPLSGMGLKLVCEEWQKSGDDLDAVIERAKAATKEEADWAIKHLREQKRDLSAGDVIHSAMGDYIKILEAGFDLRKNEPFPELAFIRNRLDRAGFRILVNRLLDCLVIQEKPADAVDMYWQGPSIAAATDEVMQKLGALQSALHYSQCHISSQTAVATSKLEERQVVCPFSGGCRQEMLDDRPTACRTAPWQRFAEAQPGDQVCWYAAGTKALRGKLPGQPWEIPPK